jgi:hypothetical protein
MRGDRAVSRQTELLLGYLEREQAQRNQPQRRSRQRPVAAAVALLLLVTVAPSRAGDRPFDGDRYHTRQDACAEKDRLAAQCKVERNPVFNSFVRRGVPEGYCDEIALRQAQRACSAPPGERGDADRRHHRAAFREIFHCLGGTLPNRPHSRWQASEPIDERVGYGIDQELVSQWDAALTALVGNSAAPLPDSGGDG